MYHKSEHLFFFEYFITAIPVGGFFLFKTLSVKEETMALENQEEKKDSFFTSDDLAVSFLLFNKS